MHHNVVTYYVLCFQEYKSTSVNLHFSGLEHVPDEPGHRGPHGRHHCHAHQLGVCNHRYEREMAQIMRKASFPLRAIFQFVAINYFQHD